MVDSWPVKGVEIDAVAAKLARRGLILLDDLYAAGVSKAAAKARVDAGVWGRRASGLYAISGAPADWRQELLAAQMAAGPSAAVSELAAAAFWGVPGFPEGPVQVMSPFGTKHNETLGELRQSCLLPEAHVVVVDGIRVTRPSRTLFDIASLIPFGRLERAWSNAIAMRLTTEAGVQGIFDELAQRGRPGTAAVRKLLAKRAVGWRADSGLEVRFLYEIEAAGLPLPECQVWLGDADNPIARVDYFWRPQRLVGEMDSDRFHGAPLDVEADAIRDEMLTAAGFGVIRFPEDEVRHRVHLSIRRLRSALAAA
jgi:hypothetical protein